MNAFDLLIEIALDAGTERLSVGGASTSDGYYDARIESFGDVVRELAVAGGVSPAQSTRITIRDADGAWRAKSASATMKKRKVTVKLYDTDSGASAVVFAGRIESIEASGASFALDVRDDSMDKLEDPVPLKIFPDIFANMPATTQTALIPVVIGTVNSDPFDKAGAVPAYLIDPKIGQTKYRYVAACHPLKSVPRVYRFGLLVPATQYTIAYANVTVPVIGTVRMTMIDFAADQREPGDGRDAPITYDATGLTADNLETGALVTNIPDALKKVLDALPFSPQVSGDFDAASITQANTDYASLGVSLSNNGLAVTRLDTKWIDLVDAFARSFNLQFYSTGAGKFAMRLDDASAPASTAAHYFDDRDIVKDSWRAAFSQDAASTIEFRYALNHATGDYTAKASKNDASEQTALGRDVKVEEEWEGIRDVNSGKKIAEIKLFERRSARQIMTMTTEPSLDLDLGKAVKVTHFAGATADALGFQGKVFEVIGLNLRALPGGGVHQELTLIDAPGLVPASPADTEPARTTQTLTERAVEIYSNSVFTPTDSNTVAWNSHDIKLSSGQEYLAVAAGSTGDMATITFVYFDPDANSAALQTTTDFKTATGLRKWIMAVCRPAVSGPVAMVDNKVGFVDVGGMSVVERITGDEVGSDEIRTNHLLANSVTAGKISVAQLSAISADLGSITAGTITGALIRTAASGARIELDSTNGFRAIDSSGNTRVKIPVVGDLIEFRSDDTTPGKARWITAGGSTIAELFSESTGGEMHWRPGSGGSGEFFFGLASLEWKLFKALLKAPADLTFWLIDVIADDTFGEGKCSVTPTNAYLWSKNGSTTPNAKIVADGGGLSEHRCAFELNDIEHFKATLDPADGDTAVLVRRNVGGTRTLQRVSMGAVDSGGSGFKALRVPN